MSGYNMEYFISDFAERTKTNLEIINMIAKSPFQDGKAYEVTQLINSFLGLVVLPNEKFKKWEKKKSPEMKDVEQKIWDLLKTCEDDNRYFNSFKDKNAKKIMEFIDHIRNSVSHSGKMGLHFYPVVEGGVGKITHIIFYDSDYGILKNRSTEEAHKKAKEFCLKLTVEEACKLAFYIADLYCLVEKSPGKNKKYESTIDKLDTLLNMKGTAPEGTVAEQFDESDLTIVNNETDKAVLKDIVNMNFVITIKERTHVKTCKCGAQVSCSMDNISIKYHKDGKTKEMTVQGRICRDCERKLVLEKMLLAKYHEIEG